jgi:hypothetical protein
VLFYDVMIKNYLFIGVILTLFFISGCVYVYHDEPRWVKDWISEKKSNPVENPPARISKCSYNEEVVYFVMSPCCDQFDVLYSVNKTPICAPSGGFSGAGDGKCPDFSYDTCEIVWKDSRSYP